MLILFAFNIGNFAYYNINRISISQSARLELEYLSNISQSHAVSIHLNGGEYMQGFLFNLMDENVKYTVDSEMQDGTSIFNWRINYRID